MMGLHLHAGIVMLVLMNCDANRLKKLENQMKSMKEFESYAMTKLVTLEADVGSITDRVAKLEALANETGDDIGDIYRKSSRTGDNIRKQDVKPELKKIKKILNMYRHTFSNQKRQLIDVNYVVKDTLAVFQKNSSSVINSLVNIVNDHIKTGGEIISATMEQVNNASVESGRLLRSEIVMCLDNISSEVKNDMNMHFEGMQHERNKTWYAMKSQIQDDFANETERLEQFKTNIVQDVYAMRSNVHINNTKMEKKVEELIGRANEVVGIIDDKRNTIEDGIMVTINALHSSLSDWSSWSDCSQTCGSGSRTRHGTCSAPPPLSEAICIGNDTETEDCVIHEFCPHWTEWTPWSQCSQTCSNGTITRDRICQAPLTLHFTCQGNMTESQTCVTSVECPNYADCSEINEAHPGLPSATYTITTWNTSRQVDVFCDMVTDGGGWTVFQHRVNGSVDFYRNFASYETGFGSLNGEFLMGLSLMHEMTSRVTNDLRIDLQRANGSLGYAVYPKFRIDAAPTYILRLGHRTDDSGISLSHEDYLTSTGAFGAVGMAFSTFDKDNDQYSSNCAVKYHGAWWYNACYGNTNLNSEYLTPGTFSAMAMTFDDDFSLKTSKMMFKAT